VTLLRTTDEVRWLLSSVVEPRGVTLQQYNVLRILRGAGERGLPTSEIGRRMLERRPGVTRLVDRLQGKGLVGRARDDGDRRRVLCSIRQKGLELLATLDRDLARLDRVVIDGLSAPDVTELTTLLNRLRAAVRQR